MRFTVPAVPLDASPAVERDDPISEAYRFLRRVSPPESPFEGSLARTPDAATVLLVPAQRLEDWAGLEARGDGHVLAPRDLARLADGIAVEVEWCPERLDRLLARRERAGVPLRAGEAVTLAVSIRRGLAELAVGRHRGADAWPTGDWWLTDAARPVFVHDVGGDEAESTSRGLLRRVAGLASDTAVQRAVARLVAADVVADAEPGAEAELFALADPEPVELAFTAPARARSLDAAARPTAPEAAGSASDRPPAFLERHLDGELSAMVSDAVHSVTRRLRTVRPRPWQLAAASAALVLGIGILWQPIGDGAAEANGGIPTPSSTPSSDDAKPRADPGPSPTASDTGAGADDGAPAITASLLDARLRCGDDDACLGAVLEDPSRALPAGAIDLPAAARRIILLDEFGGAAVLRVEDGGGGEPPQLVVIVESGGRWLLRDVHDVTEETG